MRRRSIEGRLLGGPCPMEMNQNYIDWLKSGSTEAEECMKLMDTLRNERDQFRLSLRIAEIAFIAGQKTKCLPIKDSSDSQK